MEYNVKEYWQSIWSKKKSNEVSWYQQEPKTSMDLILSTNPSKEARIIDVGGGTSNLVDVLLDLGFRNITVLDISAKALESTKQRLGGKSALVKWVECDIMQFEIDDIFDIWHDRALLHFMTSEEELKNYVKLTRRYVKESGYLILSTFSTKGPMMCSGLDTKQFSEESMKKLFSEGFEHIKSFEEEHLTPWQKGQVFIYNIFRRKIS